MNDSSKYAVGSALAIASDVAWSLYPDSKMFKLSLEEEKSPLAFIEHYHFGLASLIFGRFTKKYGSYLDSFGSTMVMLEALQSNPFAIGKSEWEINGGMMLGSFLAGLLMISIGYGPNKLLK